MNVQTRSLPEYLRLVEIGRSKGHLTYEDINDHMPSHLDSEADVGGDRTVAVVGRHLSQAISTDFLNEPRALIENDHPRMV
jgi:hypothetical protein